MRRAKIVVVGAGSVGATVAHLAALKGLGDVVLLDVVEGLPQGKALDLWESGPVEGLPGRISGSQSYEDAREADLVVITAGLARKPGMSRDDLLKSNSAIIGTVAREIYRVAPEAFVIVVTNPADVMAYVTMKATGYRPEQVIGLGGVLDASRFRTFIAEAVGVSPQDVTALVLGGHGDDMVPLVRYAYVAGIPVNQLLPAEKIAELVERTRQGGGEIVNLLKTGSAFYAPGSSVIQMAQAFLRDERRVLPVASYLDGEYGFRDIFLGVPALISGRGREKVWEISLEPEEREALERSATSVRRVMAQL